MQQSSPSHCYPLTHCHCRSKKDGEEGNDTKHKVLTWSLFLFGCLRLLEIWIQFCCLKQELPKWLTSCWERDHWLFHHVPVLRACHLSLLTARTQFLQFIPESAVDCVALGKLQWKLENSTILNWCLHSQQPLPVQIVLAPMLKLRFQTCAYIVSFIHIVISSIKLGENLLWNLFSWCHEKVLAWLFDAVIEAGTPNQEREELFKFCSLLLCNDTGNSKGFNL